MGALSDKDFDAFDKAREYGESRENAFAAMLFGTHVEVKSDKRAAATGNVFVEYQQGRPPRPSGIAISKAHWWAIEIVGVCWLVIERERLKALARRAVDLKRTKPGGDNHNRGALVPLTWITEPWRDTK